MRIISQDLKYDLPYEHVELIREEETDQDTGTTEYFVFAQPVGCNGEDIRTVAIYHTDKARAEALRSFHIAYGADRKYFRFPNEQ